MKNVGKGSISNMKVQSNHVVSFIHIRFKINSLQQPYVDELGEGTRYKR